MDSFLSNLAKKLLSEHKENLQEVTIVFPNRRAGLFFRKYLAGYIDKPVWAPQILNIDEFVKRLSSLQSVDHFTLLFILFEAYKKASPAQESFDQFYFWGEMLLKDFNEIDMYLVNPADLFVDLKNQKEIESRFDYLTAEQIELIQKFWNSFGEKPSKHQEDFLKIWQILEKVYGLFKEELIKEGLAYDGMIFRSVAEKAREENLINNSNKIIFAGFNALTAAEELIITSIIEKSGAEMFWDLDAYYFLDEKQEAGHFLRQYARHKVLGKTFPEQISDSLSSKLQEISMIGVPLAVGQAKLMGEILQENHNTLIDKSPEKTAIVLPDEQMLFPVLHALPEEFTEINITMGYPLKDTPLYGFLEHLLDLQLNIRTSADGNLSFYYQNVLNIVKHPYLLQHNAANTAFLIKKIEEENKIYLDQENFQLDFFYKQIFQKIEDVSTIFDYLMEILLLINKQIKKEEEANNTLVEKEYVFHFYTQLKRLKEIVGSRKIEFTLQTFLKLFRHIILNMKLPFSGEPLNGLQVMGVLETRNLDFENVYILSMNEGKFPPAVNQSSFIPYNIRKGYNLPTYEQQDSIYAYNFYRLLQRAKKVVLFYNTESGIQTGGEMSRFLYQLKYEAPVNVNQQILSNPIKVPFVVPISISKDGIVLEALQTYCNNAKGHPQRALTPSAFNTYLDCRLKFYFRYVLRLYETNSVQEDIDAADFGNLLHHTMEIFYKQIIEENGHKNIEEKVLRKANFLEGAVIKAFSMHFNWEGNDDFQFEGRNIIIKEIILKMGREIIKNDIDYSPFSIVSLESKDAAYEVSIPIETAHGIEAVNIKGIIDRVDKKNNTIRVIDYKTGKDNKKFVDIVSLFDRNNKQRNKAAMQTLIYTLLYAENALYTDYNLTPGLYNARELFGNNFSINLLQKVGDSKKYEPVTDARSLLGDLKIEMGKLLSEVFDVEIPFDQTSNLRICEYCPYKGICHR